MFGEDGGCKSGDGVGCEGSCEGSVSGFLGRRCLKKMMDVKVVIEVVVEVVVGGSQWCRNECGRWWCRE